MDSVPNSHKNLKLALADALAYVRRYLPIQNPSHAYIHNNVLMNWEQKPFTEALQQAARLYQARPYRSIRFYQSEYAAGRIQRRDLMSACQDHLDRFDRWASADDSHIDDYGRALTNLVLAAEDSVRNCLMRTSDSDATDSTAPVGDSMIDARYGATVQPETELSAAVLWLAACIEQHLDQGVAAWQSPYAHGRFIDFLMADLRANRRLGRPWCARVEKWLRSIYDADDGAMLVKGLQRAGVATEQWADTLLTVAHTLRGWMGIINRLQTQPDIALTEPGNLTVAGALTALLAMRTCCANGHRSDVQRAAQGPAQSVSWAGLEQSLLAYLQDRFGEVRAQHLALTERFQRLLAVVQTLDEMETRRIWQHAYELTLHRQMLSLLLAEQQRAKATPAYPASSNVRADASVWFCIDDREESLRRHFEALSPQTPTYGVLGYFGVDMLFKGLHSATPRPHCPPVVRPRRVVFEEDINDHLGRSQRRRNLTRHAQLRFLLSSRGTLRSTFSSLWLGVLSFIPLSLSILFPRFAADVRERTRSWGARTHIDLERYDDPEYGEVGYNVAERAEIVRDFLTQSSMLNRLARINILLAHGATMTNNPFRQSYGCGACSGQSGGANARAFAQMANDPDVRAILREQGVQIDLDIVFVPAEHDTTTDTIQLLDAQTFPRDTIADVEPVLRKLRQAAGKNAYERTRRFPNAPLILGERLALEHVQSRAMNLAEPRPEYGHAGVFAAVIGRRQVTRELFLDRRSFLISYEPSEDVSGAILTSIIGAAAPVCVNIGMDYYFSAVDPHQFGAGTKLPLNISSLLGVVTGGAGDLRIGLASQMVEKHEPVRVLLLVESPTERIDRAFAASARLTALRNHAWIRLAAMDPEQGQILCWHTGKWSPLAEVDVGIASSVLHDASSRAFEGLAAQDRLRPLSQITQVGG